MLKKRNEIEIIFLKIAHIIDLIRLILGEHEKRLVRLEKVLGRKRR